MHDTLISVSGRSASGLSALIAESFHFLMSPWKIPASVSAESCRSSTPERLYETVIGPATVGKKR